MIIPRRAALLPALLVLLLLLACGGAPPPAAAPAGAPAIDPARAPQQKLVPPPDPPTADFTVRADGNAYDIYKLAAYSVAGVVVSVENYYLDAGAKLSPCDIALAFSKLAENNLWRKVKWSQHDRWYWWTYAYADLPGGNPFIVANSSNNHIIPASDTVKLAARALSVGDKVELKGWLVRIAQQNDPNGFKWQTSLSREDTGDGSCEVLYLEEIRQGDSVWR